MRNSSKRRRRCSNKRSSLKDGCGVDVILLLAAPAPLLTFVRSPLSPDLSSSSFILPLLGLPPVAFSSLSLPGRCGCCCSHLSHQIIVCNLAASIADQHDAPPLSSAPSLSARDCIFRIRLTAWLPTATAARLSSARGANLCHRKHKITHRFKILHFKLMIMILKK